jgi:hypothetical protein
MQLCLFLLLGGIFAMGCDELPPLIDSNVGLDAHEAAYSDVDSDTDAEKERYRETDDDDHRDAGEEDASYPTKRGDRDAGPMGDGGRAAE